MTYLPGGRINATISGNTAGAGALVSTGTLTLAGGNNITLSQAGNAITISGGAGGGSQTFGMSNLGNTSGTSGVVSGSAVRMVFAGGNNITLSQSINASSATITISAPSQSVQTQSNIQAVYDGANSISTGTLRFSNANGVSFGINGQTLTASHNALTSQTNQTVGLYALGNSTQSSSTSLDARSISFNGLGAASMGFSNGSVQVSVPVQTVQTQNLHNLTLDGNTAGAMAQVSSGTLTLAGGNNITLSQAGNAITISGGAGGGGVALANSETTYSSGTAHMVASGALTIASTTGQSFNLSVPQTSSLIGTNGVTVTSNGSTISISGPGETTRSIDFYQNLPPGTSTLMSTINAGLLLQPLNTDARLFPANLTANTFLLHVSGNMSTAHTTSHSMTWYIAIYSDIITGLSLLNSASSSWAVPANLTNYELYNGPRWLSLAASQWSAPPVFSQDGDYVIGIIPRTSNYGPPMSIVGANFLHSVRRSGYMGLPSVSNDTMAGGLYWNATYTNTLTSFPTIISSQQVFRGANIRAHFMAHVVLNNRYAGTY